MGRHLPTCPQREHHFYYIYSHFSPSNFFAVCHFSYFIIDENSVKCEKVVSIHQSRINNFLTVACSKTTVLHSPKCTNMGILDCVQIMSADLEVGSIFLAAPSHWNNWSTPTCSHFINKHTRTFNWFFL